LCSAPFDVGFAGVDSEARVKHEEGETRSADGTRLFWQAWDTQDPPRAALLLVHGFGDHSGRYLYPVHHFVPRGFACLASDYRGHGRSDGLKGHVDGFDPYVDDVRAAHELMRQRYPGVPDFVVAHSHGAMIALRYALRHPDGLNGIVMNSPLLGIHPLTAASPALAAAGRVLSIFAPRLRLGNNVNPAYMSRDPQVVASYRTDPLIGTKASARWFTSMLRAIDEAHAEAGRLSVPALVMAAGEDRCVDPEAVRRWAARAPEDKVEFVWWDGLFHETFNEPEKQKVFERIESWLEQRLAHLTPVRRGA
jgi:alpha-beta hydrolase superfamily lysophospholipase